MNPEAIMTPGGIADQLTRGLSGLGQSFARREELRYQGQRDRMADDRYTAEMALRQQAQERADARMALEDRRYGEQQARLGRMDQLALEDRQRAQEEAKYRRNMGFLDRGVVPEGVAEFKDPNPQEAFGRFGPNDPPPGWGEGAREYTSEGKIAANAQQALTQKMEPKPFYGRTEEQRIAAAEAARRFQTERDAASVAEKDRQNQIERINKQIDKLKTAQAAQMVPEVGADRPFWGTGDYTQAQIDALPGGAARKALQGQIDDLNVELRSLQSGAASALGGNAQPQPPKGDYKSRFVDKLKSRVTPDVQP